jgi:hypothetical protein
MHETNLYIEEGLEVGYENDSPVPVQLNDPYPFNRN